ncbi:hypothetical protein CVV70_19605 [Ralstonia solanacearum]|nr:hypothetical protein CCY86_01340 [Ralstonia solanacearum]OPK47639.1 hypothetical protein B5S37_23105 [Ralstonia solanacearum]OPK47779.1 hypothetical protein B5G54_12845 [Ralstonia solanacearum]OPK51386.1 hypothetical protein B5J95_19795 [Ralstonia solanacearum]OYQ07295.1 hypothetical protein B7R79_15090 [Ralstonia solanacearum]
MADSVWAWVRTVRTWVRTPTVGGSCTGPSRIGIWPGRTPFPPRGDCHHAGLATMGTTIGNSEADGSGASRRAKKTDTQVVTRYNKLSPPPA